MPASRKEVELESLAIYYHDVAAKELVVNNQKNLITKPTFPYIEWKDLDEDKKEGRRIMMRKLLEQYRIIPR